MAGALIGALRVSLSAETSAFEAGMKRSQRTAKSTVDSIKGSFGSIRGELGLLKGGIAGFLGALSVGTILAAGKAALDYAGSLGEVSAQLGVTTKDLQVFRYAAQQNGVSLEQADKGLQKLSLSMNKAEAGSKPAIAAFEALGVKLEDIRSKSAFEIFGQMSDNMLKAGGAANNVAAGAAVMGREFQKFIPLADQGSAGMNQLAQAAQDLGIVLSDEQIQRADVTADKLDSLQTVLKAQIAGVVADNADSIVGLADAIAQAASAAARAIAPLRNFYQEAQKAWAQAQITAIDQFNQRTMGLGGVLPGAQNRQNNRNAAQRTINQINAQQGKQRYQDFVRDNPFPFNKPKRSGGNIAQFLAPKGGGGGGGGRSRKDNSAEEALRKQLDAMRDANQFDQDIRRANIDILNAKQQLATDEVERVTLSIDIKDAERAAYASQLQYEVKVNELTKGAEGLSAAQADQLLAQYDIKDSLERQKIVQDEQARAREASARVDMAALANERDLLAAQLQNTKTLKDRRDLSRKILDLEYRMERAALEAVLADEQASEAAKEIARQRLAILGKLQAQDRAANDRDNQGPLGDYIDQNSDPDTQFAEAQVRALGELEDGLTAILMGTKSVKEAFHDMAMAIVEDLIRIIIRQMIVKALMAAMGGGFAEGGSVGTGGAIGMATGGFVSGPGGPKADRIPAMLSNGEFVISAKAVKKVGLPLLESINEGGLSRLAMGGLVTPRSTMTERISVSNDNDSGRRGITQKFDLRGAVVTEDLYRRMEQIGAQAADKGGNLGVQRMRDLNQRTFGRASR